MIREKDKNKRQKKEELATALIKRGTVDEAQASSSSDSASSSSSSSSEEEEEDQKPDTSGRSAAEAALGKCATLQAVMASWSSSMQFLKPWESNIKTAMENLSAAQNCLSSLVAGTSKGDGLEEASKKIDQAQKLRDIIDPIVASFMEANSAISTSEKAS